MLTISFLGNFNVPYSSESHHAATLESMGHKIVRLQEGVHTSDTIYQRALRSDLFIWIHTHGWETQGKMSMTEVLHQLKAQGVPSMTYHLDLWLGLRRQRELSNFPAYKDIDYFFTVDSRMADWFNTKTKVKGIYLPAGVFDQEAVYTPQTLTKDVIFVGSKRYHAEWPYRPKLLEWLKRTYGKRFEHWGGDGLGLKRGQDLNDLYASSKVVVGDTLCIGFKYPDYWSDRVYETLGRGGFIIHPHVAGMEREFKDGEHLVFYNYNNFRQLKEKIDYYLENDEARERIRLAGHQFVKENYTYKHRWQYILGEIGL